MALGHILHVHDTRAVGRKSGPVLAHVGGFWTASLQLELSGVESRSVKIPMAINSGKISCDVFHSISAFLYYHWAWDLICQLCCIWSAAALLGFNVGCEFCAVSSHGFRGRYACVG